ncbi:hypothetical protein QBC43DRAFT_337081 [Cladorrhinum sp. PSN259]|nr:hypothetical protein QBC43DRAFT_337081 [Cladorrhinum sp. PSN259]
MVTCACWDVNGKESCKTMKRQFSNRCTNRMNLNQPQAAGEPNFFCDRCMASRCPHPDPHPDPQRAVRRLCACLENQLECKAMPRLPGMEDACEGYQWKGEGEQCWRCRYRNCPRPAASKEPSEQRKTEQQQRQRRGIRIEELLDKQNEQSLETETQAQKRSQAPSSGSGSSPEPSGSNSTSTSRHSKGQGEFKRENDKGKEKEAEKQKTKKVRFANLPSSSSGSTAESSGSSSSLSR